MSLSFRVEDEAVLAELQRVADRIPTLVMLAAEETEVTVREEAGQRSKRLGEPWFLEGAGMEWKLFAPQWWWHFLAHGTRDHGPRSADFLQFQVEGEYVRAGFVKGIAADPFDIRATERTEASLEMLLREVVA